MLVSDKWTLLQQNTKYLKTVNRMFQTIHMQCVVFFSSSWNLLIEQWILFLHVTAAMVANEGMISHHMISEIHLMISNPCSYTLVDLKKWLVSIQKYEILCLFLAFFVCSCRKENELVYHTLTACWNTSISPGLEFFWRIYIWLCKCVTKWP